MPTLVLIQTRECVTTCTAHEEMLTTVVVHGETFYSASWDGTVRSWGAQTGTPIGVYRGHESCVRALAVSDHNVFSASYDTTARVWPAEGAPAPEEVEPGEDNE
jgi:WD40 repeat protein